MNKADIYAETRQQIEAVIAGEPSLTARFATAACLLHHAFEDFFWTGFYMVDPEKDNELVIGPYQGTLGCLRIPFGRGVCGTSAQTRETQVVKDVHAFPGHIACDVRSNSEIVVPVIDGSGTLLAVLDVDSEKLATFDDTDKIELEAICAALVSDI